MLETIIILPQKPDNNFELYYYTLINTFANFLASPEFTYMHWFDLSKDAIYGGKNSGF